MRRAARILWTLAAATGALLVLAAPALATGEGLWGQTSDQVDTYFGFAIVLLFPLVIVVLQLISWRSSKAKERRKQTLTRLRRD